MKLFDMEGKSIETIEEIEKAVALLPTEEYRRFREWFLERDWAHWDKQIESDSGSGKLDFLVKEAMDGKKRGGLKGL
jgi:hypothetical protein